MQNNSLVNYGKIDKYDDKHIYYNATIANPTNEYKAATFVDQRSQAILTNQSDYHVSVIRFSIPGAAIPIFNFAVSNASNLNSGYIVNLNYQNLDFPQAVDFINLNENSTERGIYSYQNFIDAINAALEASFTSLLEFVIPSAIPVKPPQRLPPILILDEVTGLISLNVEQSYDPFISGANVIKIYFNQKLFSFFESFNSKFNGVATSNFRDVQLIVENKGNNSTTLTPIAAPMWNIISTYGLGAVVSYNGLNYSCQVLFSTGAQPDISADWSTDLYIESPWNVLTSYSIANVVSYTVTGVTTYYVSLTNANLGNTPPTSPLSWEPISLSGYRMLQESNTLYLWNELRTILFTTGTITVRNESVPLINAQGNIVQVNNNSLKILTDFQPQNASPTSGGSYKNYFIYYPSGPYRLLDLTGTRELTYLDFQIYWQDSLGNINPLLIPPNQAVSVKIMFMKKTSQSNNEYLTYS